MRFAPVRFASAIAGCVVTFFVASSFAQPIAYLPPQNVVQLAASGSIEVQQDLLTISMSTTREGLDATMIQSQLKTALDSALTEAKKTAQPGQLEVRTGNFSLYPRYGRDGKIGRAHV